MKKVIIAGIIIVLGIVLGLNIFIKEETNNEYELLDNPYSQYNYINSYEEYKEFLSEHDGYSINKKLDEKDFDNKMYLFYTMTIDSCSEMINSDILKKEDNKYKIYLDVSYRCGVCAPMYVTYVYEVDSKLDVLVYLKTISRESCSPNVAYKPIIYIYPKEDMDLKIKLGNTSDLLYTYPKYKSEWNVRVSKNGNIYDYNTKRNYYGLYWEAYDNYELKLDEGFVVKGSDTVSFLEEKLEILGLNEYEINEFIIYWIDKLESNPYNFISFRNIEDINMPLYFSVEPDTLIRVMMDFKKLDKPIKVKEQKLVRKERYGFTIVEWGGTYHK